ncbi:GGDEF domain-containing protein [Sulfurirhabdus autotrophica]|uniref:diguanylate cyclase n=1 Tax=Sulfurirhabdus autotrophica TaxID=1706046 RepID=A0A4R3XXS2_9PROT|nr:diguanylate cyclase [Sulfurirhabdus autotrophica]TCV84096.1 diguanylate cyclase (GGDEF)-like protein [Sulfurirhabdus autotrophica]
MLRIHELIDYRPTKVTKYLLVAVIIALVFLVGYIHEITGAKIEMHSFYMIPVVIATWYIGLFAGVLVVVISSLDWLGVEAMKNTHGMLTWEMLVSESIRVTILLMLVFVLTKLRLALKRESELARRDVLTKLANRRAFFEAANIELARAKRYGYPLTAIMIDLDNFKLVNDEQGHEVGDVLLSYVANILNSNIRSSDFAGRLGGDEFVILLPETGEDSAEVIAKKLQNELLAGMKLHQWPVTFSIGVATFVLSPKDVGEMLKCADRLMYEVKQGGKNQVKCATIQGNSLLPKKETNQEI